jgi:cytochrome c oxidase subunit IV
MTGPVLSPKTYFIVFAALLVLFGLTLAAAQLDLEPWNALIAMLIAGAKAVLIVLYFMHVRHGTRLARVFSLSGFVWLGFLLAFLMSDVLTRHWPLDLTKWR